MSQHVLTSPGIEDIFFISDSAVERINEINKTLELTIEPGGCSGFSYKFAFLAQQPSENHKIFFLNGKQLVAMQEHCLGLASGSTITFENELAGYAFKLENPKVTSKCGCGSSFNIF